MHQPNLSVMGLRQEKQDAGELAQKGEQEGLCELK